MENLKEKIKELPHKPGVYLWKDKSSKVIYVGKAKDLRKRVIQYFGHDTREQIPYLMAEVADFDFVVVNSELESLFLENTLIKKYLPAYNIKLRDDKNYAFIKIDYSTEIPQIVYARKIENDSKTSTYLGPYSSAYKIRQTLDFVRRVFPYCANKEVGKRPCFYYFLHRCPGVCIGQISLKEYEEQLKRITYFLTGKTKEVKNNLKKAMKEASRKKAFEAAARLRDQLKAIEILDERQIAMFTEKVSWDFISLFWESGVACINLFKVREGRLIDKENFIYEDGYKRIKAEKNSAAEKTANGKEIILQTFAENYYTEASDLPKEIFVESSMPGEKLVKELLKSRSSINVKISVPTRGKKLQLINLGITNAQEFLRKWQSSQANNLDAAKAALEQLREVLKLTSVPARIEGYDISNIQGTNPVGSMVVAKDGLPAKGQYRKFKINIKNTPDDFAMMEEMLTRRLAKIHDPDFESKWPKPDLLIIDGGKGQLGVAVQVLEKFDLSIPVIGLAKRIEEIFLPHNPTPIVLDHSEPALQLLQRLRDEAHRFAITFHRSLREKQAVKSALDEIPGIGPKTKKLLKQKLGSVSQIRQTSLEDLIKIVGKDKAELIKKHL